MRAEAPNCIEYIRNIRTTYDDTRPGLAEPKPSGESRLVFALCVCVRARAYMCACEYANAQAYQNFRSLLVGGKKKIVWLSLREKKKRKKNTYENNDR